MPRKKTKQREEDVVHLTQESFNELQAELNERLEVTRPEIAAEINAARELGDLSENQAYTDAMERKELNDSRIDEIEYLLSIAKIIENEGGDGFVGIGSTVEIQKVGSKDSRTVVIVGKADSQQADPSQGKISVDSPVGAALSNSAKGDVVTVVLPAGEVKYKILKVA